MMMDKLLLWNIRLVNTQNAFDKLIDLKKRNNFSYIYLKEPFKGTHELEKHRMKLWMKNVVANCSFKI